MQMGRWFGYRKGYELIPRLWLTQRTQQQFSFLSELDQSLRDEIHEMDALGKTPDKYGPRVKNSPKTSFIRITAKNRMQAAQETDMDYSGSSVQTFMFDDDAVILKHNLSLGESFIRSLGNPEPKKDCNAHSANSYVWRDVPFDSIEPFLSAYSFQARLGALNDIRPLIQWVKEITNNNGLENWNVVLAGKASSDGSNLWVVSDKVSVSKVLRTQKIKGRIDGVLNIGVLRAPKDIIADIDLENASDKA